MIRSVASLPEFDRESEGLTRERAWAEELALRCPDGRGAFRASRTKTSVIGNRQGRRKETSGASRTVLAGDHASLRGKGLGFVAEKRFRFERRNGLARPVPPHWLARGFKSALVSVSDGRHRIILEDHVYSKWTLWLSRIEPVFSEFKRREHRANLVQA